jgi:hypothetical protein
MLNDQTRLALSLLPNGCKGARASLERTQERRERQSEGKGETDSSPDYVVVLCNFIPRRVPEDGRCGWIAHEQALLDVITL